jgi:RHS repeat-associated protein
MTYSFDQLGRQTDRVDQMPDGTTTAYNWVWDTKQKGLLSSESGNGQTIDYGYDGYARLSSLKTNIIGLGDRTFTYNYDEFSRPETMTYPNGFKVKRLYHANGFHAQTQDITDTANPKVLWALGKDMDNRGNFPNQLWGNGVVTTTGYGYNDRVSSITSGRLSAVNTVGYFGDVQKLNYQYDSLGNLKSRTSRRTNSTAVEIENLNESFVYDRLNRLKTSTTSGLFLRTKSYEYDNLGNLTSRTNTMAGSNVNEDVGTLSYIPTQANNAGVHAVTLVGGVNYAYDKYGNMMQRGSETITYNVFNKPTRISSGAATTDIWYGANHERFKEVNNGLTTYTLAGGLYEESTRSGFTGNTKKSYVDGVILHTQVSNPGGTTNTMQYLHTDNLGSVDSISNHLGSVVSRMSFSDWGKRQKSDWKTGAPTETFPTAEGYTGHHQLDQHALVHMGGRVYDPNIGRFMSADLFVQSPYSSQSFNRYTYVSNNPMSRIDPTGYDDEPVDEVVVTGTKNNDYTFHFTTDFYGIHSSGAMYHPHVWTMLTDLPFTYSPLTNTSELTSGTDTIDEVVVTGCCKPSKKELKNGNGVSLTVAASRIGTISTGAAQGSRLAWGLGNPWALLAMAVLPTQMGDATLPANSRPQLFRGRIQAQGGGLERSVAWAQNAPPSVAQGLALLSGLKLQLTNKQLVERERSFLQAGRFIINAAPGVTPTRQSFYEIRGKDIRVDIEVQSGIAFVPN